jgi:hypothetical protein
VPEWLSGMTRNHVGFARAGSNPADHEFFFSRYIFHLGRGRICTRENTDVAHLLYYILLKRVRFLLK